MEIIPVQSLRETIEYLNGERRTPRFIDPATLFNRKETYSVDWNDVKGQENAKRALKWRLRADTMQ